MINTKSVIQVLVNIEGINSVQVLKDKLQSEVGNVSIIRYSVTPKNAIMYIEATPTEGLATFDLEVDGKEFSLINVVEDIVKDNPAYTEGSVQEAFAEQKSDEPLAATAIIFDHDPQIDYLLTKEFKLNQLSTYDGLLSISTENGLILIEKQCNVVIDYSTYNKDTGTVRLLQTARSEEQEEFELTEDDLHEKEVQEMREIMEAFYELDEDLTMHEALRVDTEGTEIPLVPGASEPTHPGSPRHHGHEQWLNFINSQPTDKTSQDIANLISDLDAIVNDQPHKLSERTLSLLTGRERDVAEMQKLLDVMKVDGEETILGGSKIRLADVDFEVQGNNTYTASAPDSENHEPLTEEELAQFSIGDTVVETIELKVALISFGKFDEYAASHNIVGWDLFTPTTVLIKYLEGSNTPIEKIQKFHDMMNSLDTGWIEKQEQHAITSQFVSELNQVLDRDLVQEFLNRVNKHNTFVRETTSKIRKALLDMENDFNALKDEVNLFIDWEKLTAHASRKERIEIRSYGTTKGERLDVKNNNNLALVRAINVCDENNNSDFFIPLFLVTDDIRAKYELDDYYYHIKNVPRFAFHEVQINGHYVLIEKTDL